MWNGNDFWIIMIREILFTVQCGIFLLSFVILLMIWYARKENSNTKRFFQLVGIFFMIAGIYFVGGVFAFSGAILFIYMTLFYFEPEKI